MKKHLPGYILCLLAGVVIGLQFNLWEEPEVQAITMYLSRRVIHMTDYIAIEVTENGLPLPGFKGYRDGWRDSQAAAHRADVEARKARNQ